MVIKRGISSNRFFVFFLILVVFRGLTGGLVGH